MCLQPLLKKMYMVLGKTLLNMILSLLMAPVRFPLFTSAAVMVSDLVIIPVTPSPLDFSAAGSVVTVLEAQAYSRKVEARFLITRKIEQATMLSVLKESIRDTGVKSFRTAITQRQIYVKSILDGDSVFESSDGAAKGEIEILTKEIVSIFE